MRESTISIAHVTIGAITTSTVDKAYNLWTLIVRVPGCQKFKWRLNPVWHKMLHTIRYDTIEEINVDSKAEYTA